MEERRSRGLTRRQVRVGKSPWSGVLALGPGHAVFIGRSGDNAPHAHAAIQICVAPSGSVVVRFDGGRRLVAAGGGDTAGMRHQLENRDRDALIVYLDPFSANAEAIGFCSGSAAGCLGRSPVAAVRAVVGRDQRGSPGSSILDALGIGARGASMLDPRVAAPIVWIDSHAVSGRIAAAEIAGAGFAYRRAGWPRCSGVRRAWRSGASYSGRACSAP